MWEFYRDLKPWGQVGMVLGLLGALVGLIAAIIVQPLFGIIFGVVTEPGIPRPLLRSLG